MSYQIIDSPDITEPITLAEQKAYSRIDADYSSEDSDLSGLISAARAVIEGWLNVGLANRDVQVQWNGYPLQLPLSPNVSVGSVLSGADTLPTTDYTVSAWQNKTIWINSESAKNVEWFYAQDNSYVTPWYEHVNSTGTIYTVTYNTGYTSENLPKALKQAIMAQVDWMYKNRGEPNASSVCPQAVLLASSYSRNLVL